MSWFTRPLNTSNVVATIKWIGRRYSRRLSNTQRSVSTVSHRSTKYLYLLYFSCSRTEKTSRMIWKSIAVVRFFHTFQVSGWEIGKPIFTVRFFFFFLIHAKFRLILIVIILLMSFKTERTLPSKDFKFLIYNTFW